MTSPNRMAPAFPWTREGVNSEMPQTHGYRVGEMFRDDRASWPEGAQYGYGSKGHELTVFSLDPDPEFIEDVAKGQARFALSVVGPVLFLAFRFGLNREWRDVPYSWHLQHEGLRARPPAEKSAETRALLWISLVDGRDGIVLAQRGLTLNPAFTKELNRAIRKQSTSRFDPLEVTLAMAEASQDRPRAIHRLEFASVWSDGNA